MSPHRRHVETKSHFDGRDERERLVYRATCTCGWVGKSVAADLVVEAWQTHHDEIYSNRISIPTEGVDIRT